MTIISFIDWLHHLGISVTAFLEALDIWEGILEEERRSWHDAGKDKRMLTGAVED